MDSSVAAMWTSSESIAEEMPRVRYCFPDAVMHEFGHAFGLADLYDHGWFKGLGGSMMYELDDQPIRSIPSDDLQYIQEIYHNHQAQVLRGGGSPHQ